jgi:hypothetical protein
MKIIKNEKLINRNARISSIITLVSLIILGSGMYITFRQPEMINLSILALLVGFLLSQVGIFLTNRWGRKPRPDQMLDSALKGLDKNYSLFHYQAPPAHVLVGPAGVWVINAKHQRGTITYRKDRWRQKGGGLLFAYLKTFAQEGIGRPDLEIDSDVERLEKYLKKRLPDTELPPIQAMLVFFHPDIELNVEAAPNPTLLAKKMKEFIRKEAKNKTLNTELSNKIQAALEK